MKKEAHQKTVAFRCDPNIDMNGESENESDTSEWNNSAVKEHRNFLKDELDTNTFLERKCIIHGKKLEKLLSVCRQCSNPSTITSKEECGTGVKFKTICQDSFCSNHYSWTSEPLSSFGQPCFGSSSLFHSLLTNMADYCL